MYVFESSLHIQHCYVPQDTIKVVLGTLDLEQKELVDLHLLDSGSPIEQMDKNWMPVLLEEKFILITQASPLTLYELNVQTRKMHLVSAESGGPLPATAHGNVMLAKSRHANFTIGVVHQRCQGPKRSFILPQCMLISMRVNIVGIILLIFEI